MARAMHQLPLGLRDRPRWGGRRDGAGRKRSPQAPALLPHGSRARFGAPLPAHVTLRVRDDVPSLRTVAIVHEIERTFAHGCARPGFRLVQYSLQGNHAHLIVEARDRDALGRGMKSIAARLARAVNRVAGRSGSVVFDRYHVQLLSTPRHVHNALRYVLLNARRHAAKTEAARIDPASSGRWFDGWNRQVPSALERDAPHLHRPPVARAKTWLLAVGWRRHGLLDPADVPG
jgi:REP-associated tyrosine transposase